MAKQGRKIDSQPSDSTMNETTSPNRSNAGSIILALVVAGWLWLIGLVGYVILWAGLDVARALGILAPRWIWPLGVVGQVLLMGLPLLPLARRWRNGRYRALFQLWEWGLLALLALAPLRLIPALDSTMIAIVQLAALCVLWLMARLTADRARVDRVGSGGALMLAALIAIPWLLWTGIGSPLDTLLNLMIGLLAGAFAAELIVGRLMPVLARSGNAGWNITLGGFGASLLLALLAAALGAAGVGLVMGLLLPAVGWLAVALARWGSDAFANRRAPALLIGLATALPLTLLDADETMLLLNVGAKDSLAWALQSAALSAGIALLLGGLLWLLRGWLPRIRRGWPWASAALALWVAALGLWLFVGHPGFHGDRLFVILKDQADLTTIDARADRDARLTATYERLVDHANRTQAPLRQLLDRFWIDYQPYYLVNAIEVEGGPLHRLWLESRPEVDRVIASPVLRPLGAPPPISRGAAAAPTGVPWNLSMIGADRVWEEFGVRGAGIVLGESDSGVEGSHPEIADGYRGRDTGADYNWLDPWYGTSTPLDWGGHGTHTTATVLGNTVGVAPDAEWIGCVNLARNLGNPALYLDCLQFMLAPYPQNGDPFRDGDPTRAAHVLNNSWGCPPEEGCDPTSLQPAVDALRAAGIFVVASAGNDGEGGCATINAPPALYDAAFTVGAVDESGRLTAFSSRGPVSSDGSQRLKPDIVAPGEAILSAFPNGSYEATSGTSMAGPHVAGVVALIWSANPALIGDIERTEQIIRETALPFDDPSSICGDNPQNLVGYGLIDGYAAVRAALEAAE